jgi:NADPH2 dehydrogenase/N-ethylmaleimide reductase
MHAGRIGSSKIKPEGVETVAPSAVQARGEIYTDLAGMQSYEMPRALTTEEVKAIVEEHRQAALNARLAGFDGVELHCTSGYLPMQFLCSNTNLRTDEYGGDALGRSRFAVECLAAMAEAIGADRVGLRINPGNRYNDTKDANPAESHRVLLQQAAPLGLAYLHIMRAPTDSIDAFAMANEYFSGAVILNDNFEPETAAAAVEQNVGNAVSFARHFIGNPDLVERIRQGKALSSFDRETLYTAGAQGYSDYPKAT